MLRDTVQKYYNQEVYDLSCSETILRAANEYYGFNLSEDALHMMAPFSGGMMIEGTCGALTGAIAALGILFTQDRAHTSPLLENLVQEFFARYEEKADTLGCADLKDQYRTDDDKCLDIVLWAAELLEELIEREKDGITRPQRD